MLNVLISAVGGDIGQGILKSLRMSRYKLRIIGTDIDYHAAGVYLCDKGYIVPPAYKTPKKYIKKLISICNQEKIDIVFTPNEEELYAIARHMAELKKKTKAYFVVQPLRTLSICRDKFLTAQFLTKKNIRAPESYGSLKGAKILIKKYGFPLVFKLRHTYGSRHFHIVNSWKELRYFWKAVPEALIQEYISNQAGEEYTVGVFLDKSSKALGAIAMLRRLQGGFTAHAIVGSYPDVKAVAVRAAESVGAIGPCNVQLRRDKNNKPCVIEINARISGTTPFRSRLGFNEAQACIDYFLKGQKPKLHSRPALAMRTWGELIVPLKKYKHFRKTGKIINHPI